MKRRHQRLQTWAEQIATQHGPAVARLMGADRMPPITFEVARIQGAAATSGTRITLNPTWFAQHPDDTGGVLHELAHAVMQAPTYDHTTIWLIEGTGDYTRDKLGFDTPWTFPHHEPGAATAGYQTTAHFLLWLENAHPDAVQQLCRRLSADTYDETTFEHITGSTLAALIDQYEAAQPH